jgi:hypothetical protein
METKMDKLSQMELKIDALLLGARSAASNVTENVQPPAFTVTDTYDTVVVKTAETSAYEVAKTGVWAPAYVHKWVTEKGFGFCRVGKIDVFIHCSTISGNLDNIYRLPLVVKLEEDKMRVLESSVLKLLAVRQSTTQLLPEDMLR